MEAHLLKEELILIPQIEHFEGLLLKTGSISRTCFDTVASPIEGMQVEHASAGSSLAGIRMKPADRTGCPT